MRGATKEDMLTTSYGVLKDDVLKNSSELQSIIAQMLAINPELALKMWEHLLLANYIDFKADKSEYELDYNLGAKMLNRLTNEDAFQNAESSFISNKQLTSIVFGDSTNLTEAMFWVIARLIQKHQLADANRLISLLYQNKSAATIDCDEYSFCKVITGIIEKMLEEQPYGSSFSICHHTKEFDESTCDLLHMWIEKLDLPKDIAKAYVAFARIS